MTLALSPTHRRHLAELAHQRAVVDDEGLRIGSTYTMFFAESDLMRRHAELLVPGPGEADVLDVGIGLGVFGAAVARRGVRSYTAVEAHPGVARIAERHVLPAFGCPAELIEGAWQAVAWPAAAFDAIMYDTWPPDGREDADFATFVEQVAVPCLRPGGRFSFFHSGTRLPASRAAVLDRHFASWTAYFHTLTPERVPRHWTKPSRDFLVPVATARR